MRFVKTWLAEWIDALYIIAMPIQFLAAGFYIHGFTNNVYWTQLTGIILLGIAATLLVLSMLEPALRLIGLLDPDWKYDHLDGF